MNAITVPFHGNSLYIVEYNSEPYTPMKPIVEGMGLDWKSQLAKLNSNAKRWGVTKIVIPTLGDLQEMVCLPLRKIFGWLMTISPNKVKPEIKDTITQYQNECDDVLWQYWNNKLRTNSDQRTPLRQACDRLAVGNMLISDAYRLVADRYGVEHIDQIPLDRLAEATGYVYQLILQLQPTTPAKDTTNLKALVTQAGVTTAWFNAVKQPLAMLNPNLTREISSVFAWNVTNAKLINHEYGLGVDVDNLLSANWQARIKGE